MIRYNWIIPGTEIKLTIDDKLKMYKAVKEDYIKYGYSSICTKLVMYLDDTYNLDIVIKNITKDFVPELYKYKPEDKSPKDVWWEIGNVNIRLEIIDKIIQDLEDYKKGTIIYHASTQTTYLLTKEDRLSMYKSIYKPDMTFICSAIANYLSKFTDKIWYSACLTATDFPELFKYKPIDFIDNGYGWFGRYSEDKLIRGTVVRSIIADLEQVKLNKRKRGYIC